MHFVQFQANAGSKSGQQVKKTANAGSKSGKKVKRKQVQGRDRKSDAKRIRKAMQSEEEESTMSARTFGVPIWEFFYILLAETDKSKFYQYLRWFRDNLKRYKLLPLLQYFEKFYFTEDRIKQWASWYRVQMFGCAWKLNTNMHVESWHNILKTSIMERKKNVRCEKLLRILRAAETMYLWKWLRTKYGIRKSSDAGWLAMRPNKEQKNSTSLMDAVSPPLVEHFSEPGEESESRSKDYLFRITNLMKECLSLIESKEVDTDRLKAMLKQQTAICRVLRNSPPKSQSIVIDDNKISQNQSTTSAVTGEIPYFKSLKKRRSNNPEKINPVVNQYAAFKKKKKKRTNATSVKSFREPVNRSNLATSFSMSSVGWNDLRAPMCFPETTEVQLTLRVKKRGIRMSLDGILFIPVIAGMVVPDDETGFESLNMRAIVVDTDSVACRAGITSQHYLYQLRVLHAHNTKTQYKEDEVHVIGSRCFRNVYTNTLKIEKLARSVELILSSCARRKLEIRATFLAYA